MKTGWFNAHFALRNLTKTVTHHGSKFNHKTATIIKSQFVIMEISTTHNKISACHHENFSCS